MAFKKREAVKVRPHVYVATPAYDGKVNSEYALSLAQGMQAATVYGINVTAAVMGNGAFIDLARCNFARMFLDTDCTHLFFIDADLEFEPRAFLGLIQSGHPVAAGAYRRRQEQEDYPVRWVNHPEKGGLWVENEWLMCDRVPTGFLCIERHIIEEMSKDAVVMNLPGKLEGPTPRLFHTYINEDRAFVGEDFAWCEDYKKKYNRPIHVWPDFDFKHGGWKCNFYNWLTEQVELEQKGLRQIQMPAEGGILSIPKEVSESAKNANAHRAPVTQEEIHDRSNYSDQSSAA